MQQGVYFILILALSIQTTSSEPNCQDILNNKDSALWEVNKCNNVGNEDQEGESTTVIVYLKQGGKRCSINVLRDCPDYCIWYKRGPFGCPTCKCERRTIHGIFESDIRLRSASMSHLMRMFGFMGRSGSRNQNRWPKNENDDFYVIPYVLTPYLGSDAKIAIREAIDQIETHTCVRLPKRKAEENYIKFMVGRGCWSDVGMHEGANQISIGRGCDTKGIVTHEIMHTIGFWHEHSRPDRDNHIKIVYDNIDAGDLRNFQKFSDNEVNSYGSGYDVQSIMHYSSTAFSKNGLPTLLDKNGQPLETQNDHLSLSDIVQINQMYPCQESTQEFSEDEEDCMDLRDDCVMMKTLCRVSSLRISLKKECRKSCGYC